METIKLELPILDSLDLKLEPTVLKLVEEVGEFSQVVGKFRKMSGESIEISDREVNEKLQEELIDVAQTVCSLIYILSRDHGIEFNRGIEEHIDKLKRKGYIK